MAEIKVLALDLDGTLTNDQKEVTPRTRAALDAADDDEQKLSRALEAARQRLSVLRELEKREQVAQR